MMNTFFVIFLLPLAASGAIMKRQVQADDFDQQDNATIFGPFQCLQQCTQRETTDQDRQNLNSCAPILNAIVDNFMNSTKDMPNSEFTPSIVRSIFFQPPIEKCAQQCDPNNNNMVGDLIEMQKTIVSLCTSSSNSQQDPSDGDLECVRNFNQTFGGLKDMPPQEAANFLNSLPGQNVPCKFVNAAKQSCPQSPTLSTLFATLMNIFITLQGKEPYMPTDQC